MNIRPWDHINVFVHLMNEWYWNMFKYKLGCFVNISLLCLFTVPLAKTISLIVLSDPFLTHFEIYCSNANGNNHFKQTSKQIPAFLITPIQAFLLLW